MPKRVAKGAGAAAEEAVKKLKEATACMTEPEKLRPLRFMRCGAKIIHVFDSIVESGMVKDEETLNMLLNIAIGAVNEGAEKLVVTDADIKRYGTVAIKHVYEEFRDSRAVVEDLKKGVVNRLKTILVTRLLRSALEPELKPYVERLADVLIDAHRRGGLEEAVKAAEEYLKTTKYGKRSLVEYLFVEAPDSLQHAPRTMQKFSRTALATCPGADVCAAQCYALHGNYVQMQVKRSLAMRDLFVDMLKKELIKRLGGNKALTAALLGAAFAGGVRAAGFGEIVRLHDSGDFSDETYLAAWLVASKLLPDKKIYTYTKTFPNVPGMPPVWQNAVALYKGVFIGEPPPQNFNVNVSATATNYKYIAEAAEALTKLGINVPGVFFYASANMDEYYQNKPERWRELAAALVEAARRTTGKKLILEFEHGVHRSRSARSSQNIVMVVEEVVGYAEKAGVPLRISVPKTAYTEAGFKPEEKKRLSTLPPEELEKALLDREKVDVLNEIANKLAEKYSEESAQEAGWQKTIATERNKTIKITLKRPVSVFTVPGAGEPVEVFIEPGGMKACTLCQRCVLAPHSPLKNATKISLTRGTGLTMMNEFRALTEAPQMMDDAVTTVEAPQKKGKRKKAVAA